MNDTVIALLITLVFTLVVSLIQMANDSKIWDFNAYWTGYFVLYYAIMAIGNMAATLIAAQLITGKEIFSTVPIYLWSSFLGVFGFEAIIQKINVTVFDNGVLSINDWITKAKAAAVSATLKYASEREIIFSQELADSLLSKCASSLPEIHSLARNNLGAEAYNKIIAEYTASGTAPESHLAFVLANEKATRVKTFLKSKA